MWQLRAELLPVTERYFAKLINHCRNAKSYSTYGNVLENLLRCAPLGWDSIHPAMNYCVNYSVDNHNSKLIQQDLQLVFWLGTHHWADPNIKVLVHHACTIWTQAGPRHIVPGSYPATHYRNHILNPSKIPSFDVYGFCATRLPERIWAKAKMANDEFHKNLATAVATIDKLNHNYPEVCAWVSSVTKILVPLQPCADGRIRSSSFREELGLVFLDLSDPVSFLESLIHESAHQHFYTFEEAHALTHVDDNHIGFYSPLKKTNRPIRSVFLAYHALAYIAQLFSDLTDDTALLQSEDFARANKVVINDLNVARESINLGYYLLTPAGKLLFSSIEESLHLRPV